MNLQESQARRRVARDRRRRAARRRLYGLIAAVVVVVVAVVAVASGSGGSGSSANGTGGVAVAPTAHRHGTRHARGAAANHAPQPRAAPAVSRSTVTGKATGVPGTAHIPILMYHVIAPPPPGAPFPGLYVSEPEFAAEMQALKAAGWHAVTLDQVRAYWLHGVPLGPGKPVVLTFDNGYHSQYANALPVLERMHWVADENMQLQGLPPSQGGMTTGEVKALVDAGWELDTQGISHADLVGLDPSQLTYQVQSARRMLQHEYHVPVNWFCYPSGQYNAAVIAAVKAAGFVGSTTVVPGWAAPSDDFYALPRLRVLNGTSGPALLSELASIEGNPAPGGSYITG
jgi:peptidoglycan/xylan/chitin deacetylase (PgdA/CDA1 family)